MSENQEQDNTDEITDLENSDDFDFLDENVDETNSEEYQPTSQNNSPLEKKIKTLAILSTLFLIGIIIFNVTHKKPSKSKVATDDVVAEQTTKKIIPETSANLADNTKVKPELQNNVTDIATIEPEQPSKEITDLFATTTADQSNNLEKALEQQENNPNITKNNNINPSNMELYFGDNIPNKFNKKIESPGKNQEIIQQNAKLQETIENMTQEMTENANQLKHLENKINDLTNVLSKVNQNVGEMDSKMSGLNETVDAITQDVSNVKKIITDEDLDIASNSNKPVSEENKLTYKQPGYSIHAIIPGRAWLKSPSGQIITIAEGDNIGDYGTVAVIDAANNIVRTSSGVAFR